MVNSGLEERRLSSRLSVGSWNEQDKQPDEQPWGCDGGSATETGCVPAAAQPVLSPGGQRRLPHRRLELIAMEIYMRC